MSVGALNVAVAGVAGEAGLLKFGELFVAVTFRD